MEYQTINIVVIFYKIEDSIKCKIYSKYNIHESQIDEIITNLLDYSDWNEPKLYKLTYGTFDDIYCEPAKDIIQIDYHDDEWIDTKHYPLINIIDFQPNNSTRRFISDVLSSYTYKKNQTLNGNFDIDGSIIAKSAQKSGSLVMMLNLSVEQKKSIELLKSINYIRDDSYIILYDRILLKKPLGDAFGDIIINRNCMIQTNTELKHGITRLSKNEVYGTLTPICLIKDYMMYKKLKQ
jgi:hypothetical protein